ncbi:Ribonuclease H domain [Macleaya cordata]|uniref:Ribonuclease H domain n=1 Tax=Macleaya cordata TaxID=56857 RepID=A0A200QLE6_MACCD|nr:Ribonuclease H domain [Macleaya cordata]
MEEEKDAFYVVRKGDVVGIYKSLSDCQAQVGNSVCGPSVSVFKGYSLPKETEEYLSSRGFQNAIYTVNAVDVKEDLFGELVPCPFQQPPSSKEKRSDKASPPKRSQEVLDSSNNAEAFGSTSYSVGSRKCIKRDSSVVEQASCILEFDGASKGNPGLSGAGAVLRTEDGRLFCCLREGVGIATNNVAEYRAMLLGLKHALKKGFKRISVQGDSKLVVMQVQGLWKTKNDNMATLCKEAKELKDKFLSFQIRHVARLVIYLSVSLNMLVISGLLWRKTRWKGLFRPEARLKAEVRQTPQFFFGKSA